MRYEVAVGVRLRWWQRAKEGSGGVGGRLGLVGGSVRRKAGESHLWGRSGTDEGCHLPAEVICTHSATPVLHGERVALFNARPDFSFDRFSGQV